MAASYTGLPGEAKEAHQGTMRQLERKHPGVKEHAIVGSDQDFDKPLRAGEREHQGYMRQREGMTHGQVLERRKAIRGGGTKPTRPKPSNRRAVGAGARAGRSYYRGRSAIRQTGIPSAAQSTGSLVMEAVGIAIGLSLLYLILNEKGKGPLALSTLFKGLESAVKIFINPVDPLKALSGSSSSSSAASSTTEKQDSTPAPRPQKSASAPVYKTQRQNEAFGPGVGVGTTVQPIGGY